MKLSPGHIEYWNKNLRVTAILMVIWFVVTFVIGYYAIELSAITFMGWPIPFYMGAQGSLAIYVLIIWYYASYMNKLDKQYGVHEGDDE
jgi:putative solute:sodium symporter small subunit